MGENVGSQQTTVVELILFPVAKTAYINVGAYLYRKKCALNLFFFINLPHKYHISDISINNIMNIFIDTNYKLCEYQMTFIDF